MPVPYELMQYVMNVILKDGIPQEWDGVITVTSLNPLEQYKISDMPTEVEMEDDIKYYGFINIVGAWYIMQDTSSLGALRYVKGTSDYATAWANRASLTYEYFDSVF